MPVSEMAPHETCKIKKSNRSHRCKIKQSGHTQALHCRDVIHALQIVFVNLGVVMTFSSWEMNLL